MCLRCLVEREGGVEGYRDEERSRDCFTQIATKVHVGQAASNRLTDQSACYCLLWIMITIDIRWLAPLRHLTASSPTTSPHRKAKSEAREVAARSRLKEMTRNFCAEEAQNVAEQSRNCRGYIRAIRASQNDVTKKAEMTRWDFIF